jgi:hypothetical protein
VANDSQWISRYRETVTNFLRVFETLEGLRAQYDALGYGTSLTEEDFAGSNADIDLAKLTAAVSSVEAIGGFLATGHSTNLYHLIL